MITNIPTDLLRTLIAVVELRSFTKAAQQLGVTQPAVSAQIKRLQSMLGGDLLDKSAPGVSLTPTGELVVAYGRRLLSINDQILSLAVPRLSAQKVRLGLPSDCLPPAVPQTLATLRQMWPNAQLDLRSDSPGRLEQDMRRGDLDLMVGFAVAGLNAVACDSWDEPLVWVRGNGTRVNGEGPVPLVAYGEDCASHRAAVAALNEAGRSAELVFSCNELAGLAAAIEAGIGVMAMVPGRQPDKVDIWSEAPLPELPRLHRTIYLRDGAEEAAFRDVAELLAGALRQDGAAGA